MKNKKGKKGNSGKERNVWKMVSVVFIALFILILAWGLMNTRPRPTFTEPTQEQIDMAKAIVAQDLQTRGDNIDNYEVFVTNKIVGFIGKPHPMDGMPDKTPMMCHDEMCNLNNLQVSLQSNSTAYLYLVNIDSERVVMRSFTEWFNG
ncbi:MAG: hypothetical protein NTY20_02310 [Candidatus Aenigmarchaeota archaeon]|nr:hypothetical protein [Candidatus Aenigmarchaeota archaeon]